jgi:hypothetical protein
MRFQTLTTRRALTVLIMTFALVLPHVQPCAADELQSYRDAYKTYLRQLENTRGVFRVKEIRILPTKQVKEVISRGEWKANKGAYRISYYLEETVDGNKETFDIRDAVVSEDKVVTWLHPGFPGEIQFGSRTKNQGGKKASYEAGRVGGALDLSAKLDHMLNEPATEVRHDQNGDVIVVHGGGGPDADRTGKGPGLPNTNERLEITLSREHGFLPVRLQRFGIPASDQRYEDGQYVDFQYERGPAGTLLPKKFTWNEKLKEGVPGTTLTEWEFTTIDLNPQGLEDETKLLLPVGTTAKNLDTDEVFTLGQGGKKDSAFREFLPGVVEVTSREKAVAMLATTAAGKAPYYPPGFFDVALRAQIQPRSKVWWYWLLVVGVALIPFAVWLLRRRTRTMSRT